MKKHISNNEKHWMLHDKYRAAEAETKRKERDEINRIAVEILYGKKGADEQ